MKTKIYKKTALAWLVKKDVINEMHLFGILTPEEDAFYEELPDRWFKYYEYGPECKHLNNYFNKYTRERILEIFNSLLSKKQLIEGELDNGREEDIVHEQSEVEYGR